jgi:hypothetical protein
MTISCPAALKLWQRGAASLSHGACCAGCHVWLQWHWMCSCRRPHVALPDLWKGMHQHQQPSSSHVLPSGPKVTALRVHTQLLTLTPLLLMSYLQDHLGLLLVPGAHPLGNTCRRPTASTPFPTVWLRKHASGSGCSVSQASIATRNAYAGTRTLIVRQWCAGCVC